MAMSGATGVALMSGTNFLFAVGFQMATVATCAPLAGRIGLLCAREGTPCRHCRER